MMAVSSRQIGHCTISGNISLFQIHQKLEQVAKIAACNFCDKTVSCCCTTRATAHILERPVLGQTKENTIMYHNQQKRWWLESNFEKCSTRGMVQDVREAPAPWISYGGNACSLLSHFLILVWAKLVRSRTHPDEDLQQAKPWNNWETCLCLLEQHNGSNCQQCQRAQDVCLG